MTPEETQTQAIRHRRMAAWVTLSVTLGVMTAKIWAHTETGSVALLGAAFVSATGAFSSLITLRSLRMPAPVTPFTFPVVFGVFALVALGLGGTRLVSGGSLGQPEIAFAVCLIAMFLTTLLVSFQAWMVSRVPLRSHTPDRLAYKGELLVNGAVVVVFLAQKAAPLPELDGAVAMGIGAYLAWKAFEAYQCV